MSIVRRLAVPAAAAAMVFAVGCGETVIDDVKTEDALEQNVESLGRKVKSVDCPSGVEVKPKDTFQCTVTLADGGEETAELRIINEDADVEVIDLTSTAGKPSDSNK